MTMPVRVSGAIVRIARLPWSGRGRVWVVGRSIPTGRYRVFGTARLQGQPDALPVRLLDDASGQLMASGRANAEGQYEFRNLPGGRTYLALAQDPSGHWLPAAVDRIVPAPMEEIEP